MRDRSKEISMLHDTLQILEQGYYEKQGKRVNLKLSRKEMTKVHVLLPDDVKEYSNSPEFKQPFAMGRRCG
ncbi:MAG: hypothetical protein K2K10_07815, partial [Acetatifactor sp.]|nr:hypothetical protein [Acetatifactor sp.]